MILAHQITGYKMERWNMSYLIQTTNLRTSSMALSSTVIMELAGGRCGKQLVAQDSRRMECNNHP
jgi:hypothetical protein